MTTVFYNCSPKVSKEDRFGPKFMHFHFFTKYCNQTNSRVLILNMTIFFFQIRAQKYPNKSFQVKKIRKFHFFTKLCKQTNSRVLISNMTIFFFKVQARNNQIRHFWSKIYTFSLFHKILQLDKLQGADFKYDNIVFKFQPKNTQIRHFWSKILPFLFSLKML